MGNDMSVSTDQAQSPAVQLRHFTPRGRNAAGGGGKPTSLRQSLQSPAAAAAEESHHPVKKGDRFEVFVSGPASKPAYRVGTVTRVYEKAYQASPIRGARGNARTQKDKYVNIRPCLCVCTGVPPTAPPHRP